MCDALTAACLTSRLLRRLTLCHPPASAHPRLQLYDLYAREYIGPPVDVWALGVLLYLLAWGRLPFEGEAKLQVGQALRWAGAGVHAVRPQQQVAKLYTTCAAYCVGLGLLSHAARLSLVTASRHRQLFPTQLRLSAAQVLNGRYSMPEGRPPALRALIKDCLTVSPRQRPTMQQVVARLEAVAPADLAQPQLSGTPPQPQLQAVAPAAEAVTAGAADGSERQPLHERVPSQGWADFSSSDSPAGLGSPGSGGGHSRRHSGSLASWATFSPKRAAEVVAGAAGAVAASAGSFWSSFGEQAPSEPQEPLVAPGEQAEVQALSSEVEALSSRQAALPPTQRPAQQQAGQQAAPAPRPAGAAEVSPLSAGLARMTLGGSAATPAPAPPSELGMCCVVCAMRCRASELTGGGQPLPAAYCHANDACHALLLQRSHPLQHRPCRNSLQLGQQQLGRRVRAASGAPWAAMRR